MQKIINGVVRECYPLTSAQKIHIFTLTLGKSEIANIGTGQYFKKNINFSILNEALNRAVKRCESMQLRFYMEPETKECVQYIVPYSYQDFAYYDFSSISETKAEKILDDWTSIPFDVTSGQLYQIRMVSLKDGFNGFYLNVHHCLMDSDSVVVFMKDVVDIYLSLMYDLEYPKDMSSFIESVKDDLEYEHSKKYKKDKEFWESKLKKSEPIYTDFVSKNRLVETRKALNEPNRRTYITPVDSEGDVISFHMSEKETSKILDFAKNEDVSVSAVFLHGIRTALVYINDEDDVTIKNFVSRRAKISQKRCGGVRMHYFPLRTIMSREANCIESIKIIDEEQRMMFCHADYPSLQYYDKMQERYNCEKGCRYESIGFTYQPAALKTKGILINNLDKIESKSRWYRNGKQPQMLYITAMHSLDNGGLNVIMGYRKCMANKEQINNFYNILKDVLMLTIENNAYTLQELIENVQRRNGECLKKYQNFCVNM